MKHLLVISFLTVLTLGSAAFGQKPEATADFSGTWKLKNVGKPGDEKSLKRDQQLTMELTQDATSIRVSESGSWDGKPVRTVFVYYLDGRGESNRNALLVKTTTHLVKRKLKIKGTFVAPTSNQKDPPMTAGFEEEWTLSKDGKELTKTHTQHLPETAGSFAIVDYYNYVRLK